MTDEPTTPPEPDPTEPPAAPQPSGDPNPPEDEEDASEGRTADSGDPDTEDVNDRERHPGPMVVARTDDGRVRLRDGRVIVLESTVVPPGGGVARRCQAIATRFDVDPTGAAAGQCTKPAKIPTDVCRSHGAATPQSLERARRMLIDAAPYVAERLVGLALDKRSKDADAIRAADSVLDRAALARQSNVQMDVAAARQSIAERLDSMGDGGPAALEGAESPGEGTDPHDEGSVESPAE